MRRKHESVLSAIEDDAQQLNRLCELNVIEQVQNVCHTTVVQDSWEQGRSLAVHGWIYGIEDGLLHDLDVTIARQTDIAEAYRVATNSGV